MTKILALCAIFFIFPHFVLIDNPCTYFRTKNIAKNREELKFSEFGGGEKIRIFGQNIHPCEVELSEVAVDLSDSQSDETDSDDTSGEEMGFRG